MDRLEAWAAESMLNWGGWELPPLFSPSTGSEGRAGKKTALARRCGCLWHDAKREHGPHPCSTPNSLRVQQSMTAANPQPLPQVRRQAEGWSGGAGGGGTSSAAVHHHRAVQQHHQQQQAVQEARALEARRAAAAAARDGWGAPSQQAAIAGGRESHAPNGSRPHMDSNLRARMANELRMSQMNDERAEAWHRQLVAMRDELASTQRELADSRGQLALTLVELGATQGELASTRQQLQTTQQKLSLMHNLLELMQQESNETKEELVKTKRKVSTMSRASRAGSKRRAVAKREADGAPAASETPLALEVKTEGEGNGESGAPAAEPGVAPAAEPDDDAEVEPTAIELEADEDGKDGEVEPEADEREDDGSDQIKASDLVDDASSADCPFPDSFGVGLDVVAWGPLADAGWEDSSSFARVYLTTDGDLETEKSLHLQVGTRPEPELGHAILSDEKLVNAAEQAGVAAVVNELSKLSPPPAAEPGADLRPALQEALKSAARALTLPAQPLISIDDELNS